MVSSTEIKDGLSGFFSGGKDDEKEGEGKSDEATETEQPTNEEEAKEGEEKSSKEDEEEPPKSEDEKEGINESVIIRKLFMY